MDIKLSVIIPTYNRAHYLGRTIDSFLQQKTDYSFEIIVADNNSTDQTKAIIAAKQLISTSVPIIYLNEEKQGGHFARHAAAKIARGEILYFTDDDMIADEHLLCEMIKAFDADEKVSSATGKVLPIWETAPPEWILKYCCNGWLSLANYGEKDFVSDTDPGIWSCHQALRRLAFFEAKGFNPDNIKGMWLGDGETGLNIKIKALGYHFAYQAKSITHHIIPSSRTTQAYLNKRFRNQGNCDVYTEYRREKPGKFILVWNAVINFLRAPKFFLQSLLQKWSGNDRWHITRAYSSYYLSKYMYAIRLSFSTRFKKMVLKDDWLT